MKLSKLLSVPKNAAAFTSLFLIILFSVLHAKAQRPGVGIKLGTAISNCTIKSTDPVIETSVKASVTAGLFVHYAVTKRFSIRPGVDYVTKGALINKSYNNYYSYSVRENIRFSYLDIPVNFLYNITLGQNKLFAGAGPVMSFLLNKSVNRNVAGNDLGANIMLGFEWPLGAAFIINYTKGLKNVSGGHYNETTLKNYYLGITLAYWFYYRAYR
jgi:hypothetical protein